MLTGVRASHSTFLMCGTRSCAIETSTAGLSSTRLHRPDLGVLDVDGLVEMRLERLPHEAVEPHDAGAAVGVQRRIEPHQDAAAAVGRDPHDGVGGDAQRLHQRAVEADREPRALAGVAGEMIDAGVDMDARRRGCRVGACGRPCSALARVCSADLSGGHDRTPSPRRGEGWGEGVRTYRGT